MRKDRKEGAMTSKEINRLLIRNARKGFPLSREELAKRLSLSKTAIKHREQNIGLKRPWRLTTAPKPILDELREDTKLQRLEKRALTAEKKYKLLIEENERLAREMEAIQRLSEERASHEIVPYEKRRGEATVVAVASDWHIEEIVRPDQVNGLNTYNLDISRRRADHFFKIALLLTEIERKDTVIREMVLALLGDFISGNIHEELLENTALRPIDAMVRCQEYLMSGIDFLLKNSDLKLTVVCHPGNHSRITEKVHITSETGNSLESMMYHNLKLFYRNEKRITFIISPSYHSYVTVYGKVLRFHHGHAISYGGGVGGITIPVNKAIAQWNRSVPADIDVFGHFHQAFDGNNFIANGSMIGYNAFSLRIKAPYEPPAQQFFGIHKHLGKYVVRQIYFKGV